MLVVSDGVSERAPQRGARSLVTWCCLVVRVSPPSFTYDDQC